MNQIPLAVAFYVLLIGMMRLAGKRLAGQIATFDLLALITVAVVLQQALLLPGRRHAGIFAVTVFIAHRPTASACARSALVCRFVRGRPRQLVQNGRILTQALHAEGMTQTDLLAGLRKLGFLSPADVEVAML